MSDLLNFDCLDQSQTLEEMTHNSFANEWMPSWEEKSAAAATYNHYSPGRKLSDDEMFDFCMSDIANVEDFLRSKPSPMFKSNNDFDAGNGQHDPLNLNTVGNEAAAVLASIPIAQYEEIYNSLEAGPVNDENSFNDLFGEVEYKDTPLVADAAASNIPAQGATFDTIKATGDTGADDPNETIHATNNINAGYGYAPAPTVDPFASDFNPLLDDFFASMYSNASQGGAVDVAALETFDTSAAAPVNATGTSTLSELAAADVATGPEPSINNHVSVDVEHAPQPAQSSDEDLSGGHGDFPEFPEFDDVAISPTTGSHKISDTTSHVTTAVVDHIAATKASSPFSNDVKTTVNAHHSTSNHSAVNHLTRPDSKLVRSTTPPGTPSAHAVNHLTRPDYKLGRSTTPPGSPSAYAVNISAPDTVTSTSATPTATGTSPKASATSANTSPASTQSGSISNKYVSPFVSEEEDLFGPMESFEDFLKSHSPPTSTTAATPSAKPATQDVVDLTADTPATAQFPAMGQAYYTPPMPAQPAYSLPMPTQSAYNPAMPTQPSYTPTMPTQQYYTASPYLNASATAPAPPQKEVCEMSNAEIASWLASAGLPVAKAEAMIAGLESPHYASTELPQAPYTSPMPRKRKASDVLPDQMPKKARVESPPRPIAQPRRRHQPPPANGFPTNYSWLASTASPTPPPTTAATRPFTSRVAAAAAAAAVAPASAFGSDPAPLLAFTINGKVRGCTRVSDEQWAKMYDSAVVNGGKVRMKGARWARLWVTGKRKVVQGVERCVVAVVLE